MNTPALRDLLAFWAPVLRVQDWQIEADYDPKIEALGVCYPDHTYRRAKILLSPTQEDVESSLVHELLHLHFAPFETEGGSAERTEEERAVESLMRGFIDMRRSGAPDAQARARAAFAARARARSSFPSHGGAGERKTRMDIAMLLAALRAALAAEDPAAAKAQIQTLVSELEKSGTGGDMPPPSSAMPPGEDPAKPPMAAAPPGEDPNKPAPCRTSAPVTSEIEARLRALEAKHQDEAKARQEEQERRRVALFSANEGRIPEAQRAFAKALPLPQLEAFLSTAPAAPPRERNAGPVRGPTGSAEGTDPDRLARMRASMGIPDPHAKLPGRDERGRRTWPVNAPSALRRALAAGSAENKEA